MWSNVEWSNSRYIDFEKFESRSIEIVSLLEALSQRVYRNPRPTHIKGVMQRLRVELKNTDPKTLTRLVHALPAKMNEIYRLKGKKIPSNFDPRKSSHACKCFVCESWDIQCKVEIVHKMFENYKTFLKMKIIWSIRNSLNFFKKVQWKSAVVCRIWLVTFAKWSQVWRKW